MKNANNHHFQSKSNLNYTILQKENSLLSICIPTFNHAQPLKKCLEALIPQAKVYNIPIYVSDNASTDNTLEVLKNFKKIYSFLHYKSNSENLEVDKNIILSAQMASSKYVWTFGSRRILLPGMLQKVYELLSKEEFDLIVLNDPNPIYISPESKYYDSSKTIFTELNRNLTGVSFQVLPLEAWKSENIQKYINTELIVFGAALEYVANKQNVKAYFISEPCCSESGKSHWSPRCFQIWKKWKKAVYLLPDVYSSEDKEAAIKKGLNYFFHKPDFDLINLRTKGIYNSKVFEAINEDLIKYSSVSASKAYIISKTPIIALKIYLKVYDTVFQGLSSFLRLFINPRSRLNPTKRNLKPRRINY
jgi:abequosyltransferase